MSALLGALFVAGVCLTAVGVALYLRGEGAEQQRLSRLRMRQLDREIEQSRPISWRR